MKAFQCLLWTLALCLMVQVATAQESAPSKAVAGDPTVTVSESAGNATPAIATDDFSSADIAWMLTCSALVLMMTAPGLALFYGGLVRKKNVLSVMMQCVFLMGLMSVLWAVIGYSLAFGGSNPYIGSFDHLFLQGVTPSFVDGEVVTPASGTIPATVFMCFQGMFFIITPALICGAFAERLKFSAMCVFMVLWGLLIYCPICHWVWSDVGWLCEWNENAVFPALDFAGGTVVHISSGVSALVCAIFVGRRMGYGRTPMPPHNLSYTVIGTALLWVGWFGFNAGSALSAGTGAVNAFVATHFAAAAGVLAWAGAEWILRGKASMLGGCSGAVAGLVCITPACGSVTAMSAIILGLGRRIGLFLGLHRTEENIQVRRLTRCVWSPWSRWDRWRILTGVFASRSITGQLAGDRIGLIEGKFENFTQLINQLVSIAASAGLAIVGTVVLLTILNVTMGLRVSPEEEQKGLDISQHGEEGYIFL